MFEHIATQCLGDGVQNTMFNMLYGCTDYRTVYTLMYKCTLYFTFIFTAHLTVTGHREAAKKRSFFSGPTNKAFTPPPTFEGQMRKLIDKYEISH